MPDTKNRTFNVKLSEDNVIFLTELLTIFYLHSLENVPSHPGNIPFAFYIDGVNDLSRDTLQRLLQSPLKDPLFREEFNEHFAHHPVQKLREDGIEWFENMLQWEE
ncbi:MAG TPA: hypothetical protein ENI56_01795 [Candidatus Kaiserbacteria bacterium]|nr:hypothetical protein [Candidatus Kaiserbacteria bacterium]